MIRAITTGSTLRASTGSSPTSRSGSCTRRGASDAGAQGVLHQQPRGFGHFALTGYPFYLMVLAFQRRDQCVIVRVPFALGGGEVTTWQGFGSRTTSPSRARSVASRSSARRPASSPSCASASTTRSRACGGRKRRWPRASAHCVARLVAPSNLLLSHRPLEGGV